MLLVFIFILSLAHNQLKSRNLLAVIGPYHRAAALATESLNIPYFTVTDASSPIPQNMFSLIPDMEDVGLAAYDIANKYKWEKISVFYDDERGDY